MCGGEGSGEWGKFARGEKELRRGCFFSLLMWALTLLDGRDVF